MSGIESVYPSEDLRPVIVGERTNVIGSRRFKELIVEEKFEEASEIGRAQVRGGAQVLDVCLANPDRDEAADMDRFMDFVTRKVKAPLMIDSTDARVLELALRKCQGKALVNSINLEDGEERFERVVPLIRTYGAAVVVGCIDEDKQQGMAVTRAAQAGHRGADPRAADREVRRPRARPDLRPARLPGGHRRRQLHRLGGRDHRGRAGDQGPLPRAARRSSASRTCRSACPPRAARCSTRSSSTSAPRPASTTRSSTASGSSATPRSRRRSAGSPRTSSTGAARIRWPPSRPTSAGARGPRRTPASSCRSTSGSRATSWKAPRKACSTTWRSSSRSRARSTSSTGR